jgi:hypothetical protein
VSNTVSPSPSMCLLNRMPGHALAKIISSIGLAALKWIMPQVVAVQLNEVERIEEDALVSPVVTDRSNEAIPLSSQATASPSMMQERERRRASASTISGKRWVRSLPGRL